MRLQDAALFEGDEAVVAEDDVVQQFDAEDLAGFRQPLRDAAIFGAGGRVAAGMVVGDDDGGGAGDDRIFVHKSILWNRSPIHESPKVISCYGISDF